MAMDIIGGWDREEIIGDEFEGEVGDDYAVGDDVESLLAMTGYDVGDEYAVGAAPARRAALTPAQLSKRFQAARAAKMRKLVDPRVVAVAPRRATRQREFALSFDSQSNLAAGSSRIISANPQVVFRGERLVVPSAIAGSFLIDSIVVGKDSQQVAPGSLPAAIFSEVAVGMRLKLDTAQPGIQISLGVTNVSAGPLRFTGALVGTAVE